MALQIRRFQEERDRWEIEREHLQGQADAAAAERDALLEVSFKFTFLVFHKNHRLEQNQSNVLFQICFGIDFALRHPKYVLISIGCERVTRGG